MRGDVRRDLPARQRRAGSPPRRAVLYGSRMFGLSFGELLIIAVLALLLLGPERLPEAAKTFGKGLRELRRATEDLKDQVEHEIYADEKGPPKPALVPPVPSSAVVETPPVATFDNVPGLEVALAEPAAAAPLDAAAPASPAAPSAAEAAPSATSTAAAAPAEDRSGTT